MKPFALIGVATLWAAPVLGLAFLAARSRAIKVILAARLLYFPCLFFLGFAFYWFWGGDGPANLWLVPPLFVLLGFLFFRYVRPKSRATLKGLDGGLFLIVLAGYLTVGIVSLLYGITGSRLVIE